MAETSFQERTEKATPKRREEARRKGQVAKSRELPSVAVLLAGTMVLFLGAAFFSRESTVMMRHFLGNAGSIPLSVDTLPGMARLLTVHFFTFLAPFFLVLMAMAVFSNLLQCGFVYAPEAVKPDFSKLNPFSGLKRLFSRQALAEFVKSLVKLGVLAWIGYAAVRAESRNLLPLVDQGVQSIFTYSSSIIFSLLWKTGLAMALMAALDYLFQRWEFERNLRMTRQEVKEEYKQTEGDPQVKSRIRSIQRAMARKRMMAAVPEADVVITNPTHLAVALSYRPGEMDAPVVVAKGSDHLAERIKAIASENGVPVLENKPLAQGLFKLVDVGAPIPETLYQAVAEVLAFVFRMKGRRSGRRGG